MTPSSVGASMRLVFLYGPPAAGKLTVARELAQLTGFAVFHNHLVVDAVGAVFEFGSAPFRRLREQWWLAAFEEAALAQRSLIFTFAPEPTVARDFPARVQTLVEAAGGRVVFVRLDVSVAEQERRLVADDRAAHGKLRSLEMLRSLAPGLQASLAAMPEPALVLATDAMPAPEAARRIAAALGSR